MRFSNDAAVATGEHHAGWSPAAGPPSDVPAGTMAPPLWEECCSPYACNTLSQAASCWTRPDNTPKPPSSSLRQNLLAAPAPMPSTRSPVSASLGSSFHFLESGQLLGTMQAPADDRSLPPTPRSPSPTCSPPSSPKRHRNEEARSARSKDAQQSTKVEGAGHISDSAAEDDLEIRAAALGLNETTQRVWRETNLPPTPSSPSPTFSPPSSPKQRRQVRPSPSCCCTCTICASPHAPCLMPSASLNTIMFAALRILELASCLCLIVFLWFVLSAFMLAECFI